MNDMSNYLDSVDVLVDFLDHKDVHTKEHCDRVTKLAVAIGQAMEFDYEDVLKLAVAAMLHDVGKIIVPNDILNKEGKLTTQEYEIIKMHPIAGYELIKDISYLEESNKYILQHHERVDGKGYPMGLNDEQIEISAKILAVADAYDAMTSSRPYRKAGLSKEQAIHQLEQCKGSQFDGTVVDVFVSILESGRAA